MPWLSFISSIAAGFTFFYLSSNPKKYKRKISKIYFGRIHILPSLTISFGSYKIWLHHWIYLSLFFITLIFLIDGVSQINVFVEGFLIGGIVQGLSYHDRFQIIKKNKIKKYPSI